jgi:16S rRNA (uracil1498-N3)-methyltransferase
MHRFYLQNLRQPVLTGPEAHHAMSVLRIKTGDPVTLFDGTGHEAHCRVESMDKTTVHLKILQETVTPPLPARITLAQAIPKKNMDIIIQKATELGVAGIVPLMSERTLVQLDADAPKVDRWRSIALEACKQSGNNWLPEVHPPAKARDFLTRLAEQPRAYDLKLIASLQPDAQPLKPILAALERSAAPVSVLILIGPEGDFTPAELSLAKSAGCLPLSLGPLILRAETAALYALSILHHELQVAQPDPLPT